jgi:hypothetical protein
MARPARPVKTSPGEIAAGISRDKDCENEIVSGTIWNRNIVPQIVPEAS